MYCILKRLFVFGSNEVLKIIPCCLPLSVALFSDILLTVTSFEFESYILYLLVADSFERESLKV